MCQRASRCDLAIHQRNGTCTGPCTINDFRSTAHPGLALVRFGFFPAHCGRSKIAQVGDIIPKKIPLNQLVCEVLNKYASYPATWATSNPQFQRWIRSRSSL